jgi:hypothetical protein
MATVERVTVSFELQLFTGQDYECVTESALRDDFDSYRERLAEQDALEGAIVIEVPGQPRCAVEDELWAAAQNLCFSMVARVLEESADCLLYRRTSSEGYVVMIPAATTIRLIGDEIPAISAPRSELLPALHECGVRLIDLLERVGGPNAALAEHLRPFQARARAALAA